MEPTERPTGKKKLIIIVLVLLALGIAAWRYGSSIVGELGAGATGEPLDSSSWQTARDDGAKATYRFPANLDATYIRGQEWPPVVTVSTDAFSCRTAEDAATGKQVQRKIMGHKYCVTTLEDAAAGTVYSTYTYTSERHDRLITLRFVLALPQCGNYADAEKAACEAERQSFDVDKLVDAMLESMVFDK